MYTYTSIGKWMYCAVNTGNSRGKGLGCAGADVFLRLLLDSMVMARKQVYFVFLFGFVWTNARKGARKVTRTE